MAEASWFCVIRAVLGWMRCKPCVRPADDLLISRGPLTTSPHAKTCFATSCRGGANRACFWRVAFDGFSVTSAAAGGLTLIHRSIAASLSCCGFTCPGILRSAWNSPPRTPACAGCFLTRCRRRRPRYKSPQDTNRLAPSAQRTPMGRHKFHDASLSHRNMVTFVAMTSRVLVSHLVARQSFVSVEDEIEIGRQANAQVRKQVPEVRDAPTAAYIRAIGARLVRHAPGPKYPYSFSAADYREINAFALPGGPVWIHRGVLHSATNESQVAGVLAHEIAHIAQRHAADQLTKGALANLGLGLLGALLGNSAGAGGAQIAAGLLTNGIFLKFSRDDEREADQGGWISCGAGMEGRGMVELSTSSARSSSDRGVRGSSPPPSAPDSIAALRPRWREREAARATPAVIPEARHACRSRLPCHGTRQGGDSSANRLAAEQVPTPPAHDNRSRVRGGSGGRRGEPEDSRYSVGGYSVATGVT